MRLVSRPLRVSLSLSRARSVNFLFSLLFSFCIGHEGPCVACERRSSTFSVFQHNFRALFFVYVFVWMMTTLPRNAALAARLQEGGTLTKKKKGLPSTLHGPPATWSVALERLWISTFAEPHLLSPLCLCSHRITTPSSSLSLKIIFFSSVLSR